MLKVIEKYISDVKFRFYYGMDLEQVINHPSDGTEGCIVCLVDSWVGCIKNHNRKTKIENIMNNSNKDLYEDIELNNSYVMVYQCGNIPKEEMLDVIMFRLENVGFIPNAID